MMPAPRNPRGGKSGRKKVASVADAVRVPAMPADSVLGSSLSRAASSLLRLTTSSTLSSAGSIVGDVGHRMSPHHHCCRLISKHHYRSYSSCLSQNFPLQDTLQTSCNTMKQSAILIALSYPTLVKNLIDQNAHLVKGELDPMVLALCISTVQTMGSNSK